MLKSLTLAIVACVVFASASFGQPPFTSEPAQPTPRASQSRAAGKWMVEVHGGIFDSLLSNDLDIGNGSGGSALPVGTPFTTVNARPSRAVPSWVFGDGAALFNEIRQGFANEHGLALPGITPLDAVMRSAGIVRTPGTAFGARVSRDLTSWFAAEFSVDHGPSVAALSNDITTGVEATRASYKKAFEALLTTIPQTFGGVTATATTTPQFKGQQTIATANAVLSFVRTSRVRAHVTIGGGLMINDTRTFEAAFEGSYKFAALAAFSILESEKVNIRFTEKKQLPVGAFGFGVAVRVAGQSGVRVDARILGSLNSPRTMVDATPSHLPASATVAFPSISTPSVQFSTLAGARTTLSGEPVHDLVTYSADTPELRPHITFGYFVRF